MKVLPLVVGLSFIVLVTALSPAANPYESSAAFEKYARTLRESALVKLEPRIQLPTQASPLSTTEKYPWKRGIVTTIFWVGESAAQNNPVHNFSSSWDIGWWRTFGGFDDPDPSARLANRKTGDFRPAKFIPKLNPFYFALPYNDVSGGQHKPEASKVIPWFNEAYTERGKSVVKDRWICIRNRAGIECYAQWGDCGPFRTDHYNYVFGNEKPKPNLNQGAGLDISPAVRDFLGFRGNDVTDWRFVEGREVPIGPWARYGENNDVARRLRNQPERLASVVTPVKSRQPDPAPAPAPPPPKVTSASGPVIDLPTNR